MSQNTETRYIQDPKTGKLVGSIGAGATNAPVVPRRAPAPRPFVNPLDNIDADVEVLPAPIPVAGDPADLREDLRSMDQLGLAAADAAMDLRAAETALRSEDRDRIQALAATRRELHAAVQQARDEIRAARRFLEGQDAAIPAEASTVIAADAMAWEAMDAADLIDQAAMDSFLADPAQRRRYRKAEEHIAAAQEQLRQAIERARAV